MPKKTSEDSQRSDDKPQEHDKGKHPTARKQPSSAAPDAARSTTNAKLQQQLSGKKAMKAMHGDGSSTDSSEGQEISRPAPSNALGIRWSFERRRESPIIPNPEGVSFSPSIHQPEKATPRHHFGSRHESRQRNCAPDPGPPSMKSGSDSQTESSTSVSNMSFRVPPLVVTKGPKRHKQPSFKHDSSVTLLPSTNDANATQQPPGEAEPTEERSEEPEEPKEPEATEIVVSSVDSSVSARAKLSSMFTPLYPAQIPDTQLQATNDGSFVLATSLSLHCRATVLNEPRRFMTDWTGTNRTCSFLH